MTTILMNIHTGIKILFQNLWGSVSSVNFYLNIYRNYKGYGIRYIFTVSFIPCLLAAVIFLYYILTLRDYFINNLPSPASQVIEHIINQLPDIDYNGKNISTAEEPFYLYDLQGRKVMVIDSKNSLTAGERLKIPLILTSREVVIIRNSKSSKNPDSFISIPYRFLFGTESTTITPELLKVQLSHSFKLAPGIFIYITFPAMVMIYFLFILLQQSFTILIIYFLTYLFGPVITMQKTIRLVLFSCGVPTLFLLPVSLFIANLSAVLWAIQIWANFLLFLALLKIKNNRA